MINRKGRLNKNKNMFKNKLQLKRGTRLTSGLFIAASFLVAASVIFGANMYYDIDTGTVMMGDSTEMSGTTVTVNPSGAVTITAGAASVWQTTVGDLTMQSAGDLIASSSENILLFASGVERMRIASSSGFVGIGTSTPGTVLDIYGTTTAQDILPAVSATYDLGSAGRQWANLFVSTTTIDYLIASNVSFTNVTTTNLTVTGDSLFGNVNELTVSGGWTWQVAQDLNSVALTNANIDSGAIDGTPIGDNSASTGVFTNATSTNLAVTGNLILGTITQGTIGGSLTWSAAQDFSSVVLTNVNIDSGDISAATISGGLTWNAAQDFNNQNLTNIDIDSGAIDGTTIGLASASTGAFTTLTASGTSTFATTVITYLEVSKMTVGSTNFTILTVTGTSTMATSVIAYIEGANASFTGELTAYKLIITSGGEIDMQGGNITNVGDITGQGAVILSSGGSGDLTLDAASGDVIIAGSDNLLVGGNISSTETPAAIRKSGELILREMVPIFGFDLPAQTASQGFVTTTREIEDYPFAPAIADTTRVHKLIIRYADATTTASSTWRIWNTTTGATTSSFTIPASASTDLEKGEVYIKTVTIPTNTDDWKLDVTTAENDTPGTGTNTRIYQIFLAAYDQVD